MPKKFKFGTGGGSNKGLLLFGAVVVVAVIAYFVFFKSSTHSQYDDVAELIANIYFVHVLRVFNFMNPNEQERTKFETVSTNFIKSRLTSKGYTYQEVTLQPNSELNPFVYPKKEFINIKKGDILLYNSSLQFLDKNGKAVYPNNSINSFTDFTFQNSDLKDIFTITIEMDTFDPSSFESNYTEIKMLKLPKITWKI